VPETGKNKLAQQDTAMCVTDQLGKFMTNWAHALWKRWSRNGLRRRV